MVGSGYCSAVAVALTVLLTGVGPAAQPASAQGGDAPPCQTAVPYPDALNIVPPDASVAPSLGTLVGVWEGTTSIGVPNRLVVERIDGATATGVRLNGDGPNTRAFIMRFVAQASPEGRIEWLDGGARYSYVLGGDQNSVQGAREQPGAPSTTVMLRRCTWQ